MSEAKIEDKKLKNKLRKSRMVSEGGLGTEAYYDYDDADGQNLHEEDAKIKSAKMVSEGGMGAKQYYNEDEIVADDEAADEDLI